MLEATAGVEGEGEGTVDDEVEVGGGTVDSAGASKVPNGMLFELVPCGAAFVVTKGDLGPEPFRCQMPCPRT